MKHSPSPLVEVGDVVVVGVVDVGFVGSGRSVEDTPFTTPFASNWSATYAVNADGHSTAWYSA